MRLIALVAALFIGSVNAAASVDITRKGKFEVYSGDTLIGQHSEEKEAYETVTNHALTNWQSGTYRISPPGIEVKISLPDPPAPPPRGPQFMTCEDVNNR